MKKLLNVLLLFLAIDGAAQSDVRDLIDAADAKKFLHLEYSPIDKKFAYILDEYKTTGKETTISGPLTVTMPRKRGQLPILLEFKNPINYSWILTDTSYSDPQNEVFSKMGEDFKTLGEIVGQSIASDNKALGLKLAGATADADLADAFKSMRSKNLSEWKLFSLEAARAACVVKLTSLIKQLAKVDNAFFDAGFVDAVKTAVSNLSKPEKAVDFRTAKTSDFDPKFESWKNRISSNNAELTRFSGMLDGFDFSSTDAACDIYLKYTKDKFSEFVSLCEEIQKKRVVLQKSVEALDDRLKKILLATDDARNVTTIKRVEANRKSIHEVGVVLKNVNNKLTEESLSQVDGEELTKAVFKVRTFRSPIIEYSAGVFYTNLTYPKYGTVETAGVNTVQDAGKDHYRTVAANFINLIFNSFQNDVQPLIQLGVGTGKELPSVLAGTGLRFFEPVNFALTFGGLWTWRKQLDKLQVGSVVKGTAELEEDLKYQFKTSPSFYIGIQYNF